MATRKTKRKIPKVYEFTVTLEGTQPTIWRKFLAHEFILLGELHMLIQMTMGWKNSHLFSFEIDGKTISDDDPEMDNELSTILGEQKIFTYTYDFGDDWKHRVEVTNVLDDDPRLNYPICIGGENACPPEDCGGTFGFEELKEKLAGPEGEERDEVLEWLGGYYNPLTFDPNFVNSYLLWNDDL